MLQKTAPGVFTFRLDRRRPSSTDQKRQNALNARRPGRRTIARVLRDRYPDLDQFLAGRFHQDWPLDASNDLGMIELFLSEEPPEFVDSVRRQIRALIGLGLSEQELQDAVWRDFGCEYDPTIDGLSVTQWVQSVAARLDRGRRPPK
jgi:CdiI immunity protein